jgi:hypothetical protein
MTTATAQRPAKWTAPAAQLGARGMLLSRPHYLIGKTGETSFFCVDGKLWRLQEWQYGRHWRATYTDTDDQGRILGAYVEA